MYKNSISIGADNGLGGLKIRTSQTRFFMENKIDEGKVIEKLSDIKSESYNVIYKNKEYLVGKAAQQPTGQIEGKNTERHLISLLTGLTQVVPSGYAINLGTGESMNKYFDRTHKENLKKRLLGEHEIIVDGKTYNYYIKNVDILPEGCGNKLLNFNKYKDKISHTVDMGAGTVNYIFSQGIIPIEEKSKSFQLGMHKLVSNIKTELGRNGYGANIPTEYINKYIEEGSKDEVVQQIVDKEKMKILNDFCVSIQTTVDLDSKLIEEIEFIGGTSLRLERQIKTRFNNAKIIDDAMWVNSEGFAKFVIAKYSR